MNPRELEISDRSYDILAAIAVGIAAAFLSACLYFIVGFCLGMFAVHRSPTDTSRLYFYFSPVVLIPGFLVGRMALHNFRKRTAAKRKST